MSGRTAIYGAYLALVFILVVVDQVTKHIAYASLLGYPPVDVLPVLQWALVFNRGAAFGFLNQAGGAQTWFFAGVAIVLSLVFIVWLWRVCDRNRLLSWGLALVLAGAVGNLIDRVRLGYVIDFINLHWNHWYFPAFNVADMAITFGAILLIADSLGLGESD